MRDTVVKMVNVAQKKLQPKKKEKWLLELLDGCINYNQTFYIELKSRRIGKSDSHSNFQNGFALHQLRVKDHQ